MRSEKGSALITVILVVLVLTMVGLASLYYMSIEDTISGNDRYQKEALYMAELGLRQGEGKVAGVGVAQITALLQTANAHNQVPPTLAECRGTQYLGAVLSDAGGTPMYDMAFPYNDGSGRIGYYSVYVRNNRPDGAGSPTIDADGYVDILAVGSVKDATGKISYQKILSEEFFLGSASGSTLGPQIGGSQSGGNAQSY